MELPASPFQLKGYIRISQRANRMNLRDFRPIGVPPVAQSSVETGFPRGSTGAHCARPAAWRPWHAVRGAVGRPWPVDYGENRIGNPFDHAAAALVGQENHVLGRGNCYWQSRIEPIKGLRASITQFLHSSLPPPQWLRRFACRKHVAF